MSEPGVFEKYQTNSMAGMECAGKTGDKVKVEMKQIFQGLIGHCREKRVWASKRSCLPLLARG